MPNTKQSPKDDAMNPVKAGIAGAALVTGVAVAAGVTAAFLSDEKNRKKAKDVFNKVKDEVQGMRKDLGDQTAKVGEKVQEGKERVEEMIDEVTPRVKKMAEDMSEKGKKTVDEKKDEVKKVKAK